VPKTYACDNPGVLIDVKLTAEAISAGGRVMDERAREASLGCSILTACGAWIDRGRTIGAVS